ncbi:cob(I)yrinic acid a,c-diamide adenosyltransferase [Anaerotalea alkaliphila]|uniref:Cob(I)yrinic acid a,c-diamide adenosyltransferase n=1 Tax=Anaerotalea alkaliphila TaxID=2662126 RepID=A0A7X5HT78_9FIRM|nr:cob(I)yrinic acid a,c-diamide adenosyltransferase [Anaerotalea alkaliphila]
METVEKISRLVTEMRKVRHHYGQGAVARQGIEF